MKRRRNGIGGLFSARLIEMLESPAYRVLSLSARRLIDRIEIEHASHGRNDNGRLPVTKHDFIDYGIHHDAIAPAKREAEDLGFIRETVHGSGGNAEHRQASCFFLTFANSRGSAPPPTDDWRKIKTIEEAEAIAVAARNAKDERAVALGQRSRLVTKAGSQKNRNRSRKPGPKPVPETRTETTEFPVPETRTTGWGREPGPLSRFRGGGGGSGGDLERQAPPSQGSRGNGHDAAPAPEVVPANATAAKGRGRPPLGAQR
jgi:hypothetical protein